MKYIFLPLIALFFVPSLASAAVGFSATSSNFTASGLTATLSHTTAAGSNLDLFVCVDIEPSGGASDNLTGITWNAHAMTFMAKIQDGADWGYLYGISGGFVTSAQTANIVASFSPSTANISMWASSYTGTDQSGTFNGTASSTTTTTPSDWITVNSATSWVGSCGNNQGNGTMTLTSTGKDRIISARPWSDTNTTVSSGNYIVSYSQTPNVPTATFAAEIAATAVAGGAAKPIEDTIFFGF